ncbi:MAG: sigma-70 family RNA polymerase sigma factor, partial [Myxococcales bacterium]|nr:sigma-70 family RNA polymerase sigma factor [Myxococcales bacterium]
AARDAAAFRELVRSLHTRLVSIVRRIVSDDGAAEDVVQETWRRVVSSIQTFDGRSRLATWITGIAINRARTRRSVDRRRAEVEQEASGGLDDGFLLGQWREPPGDWGQGDPEDALQEKQLLAVVERCLEALPERQRMVVVLRDVEGFDGPTTARMLDLSEENQRVLLHRGRARLRTAVDRSLRAAEKAQRAPRL